MQTVNTVKYLFFEILYRRIILIDQEVIGKIYVTMEN